MAEAMPDNKGLKTPVESSDKSLDEIEVQVRLLFDEFLNICKPAKKLKTRSSASNQERADSPLQPVTRSKDEKEEAFEDDLVTDSEIISKDSSLSPQNGSQDPAITKLALKMQEAGDALYKDYEGRVEGIQSHLVEFVTKNVASLSYEKLSKEIDNMVGRERSWTNFVVALCVGRRVCAEASKAYSGIQGYFERYVSQSYGQAMQQAGGLEPFVTSKGQKRQ